MIRKIMTAVCVLFLFVMTGCSSAAEANQNNKEGLKIVATVFPVYDWLRQITAGSDAEVMLLMKNGSDLHSFQPSARDIMDVHNADLFVYVGGESDEWVRDVLKEAPSDMHAMSLLEIRDVALLDEEIREGMTVSEEEHEEEESKDEHVWLSLANAEICVQAFSRQLQELDPAHAGIYEENTERYLSQLKELDEEYRTAVSEASFDTLIFADRFPFAYLVHDYGLSYYAAFVGCSAETEASFETVIFLSRKLDELNLKHVFVIENSASDFARTVISSSQDQDRDILVLDSMQSVSADRAEKTDYLTVMRDNLEVLKKGLN